MKLKEITRRGQDPTLSGTRLPDVDNLVMQLSRRVILQLKNRPQAFTRDRSNKTGSTTTPQQKTTT